MRKHSTHHILLVEDDPDVRAMFQQILAAEGYCVTLARTGRQALAAVRDAEFQLVISDLSLPDAGGTDLIEQIRSANPLTEILAISGFMVGMSRSGLLAAGASDTLAKPTSPRILVGCVRALLAAQSAHAMHTYHADRVFCVAASVAGAA
jgi:DNA-binding response OmpR family regulator